MNTHEAYAAGFEQAHRLFDVDDAGANALAQDEVFGACAYLYAQATLYERSPTTPDAVGAELGVAVKALETALEKRGEQLRAGES